MMPTATIGTHWDSCWIIHHECAKTRIRDYVVQLHALSNQLGETAMKLEVAERKITELIAYLTAAEHQIALLT